MAFFENCVERATALAATCGWLAFGGGAEAAVGVAIGGAGLAAVVSDAVRRHGPESEAALKSIRKRIAADLAAHAKVERWDTRADLEAADASMERALAGCFLDRKALAASARSPEGFPGSATKLILARLAEREPATFGQEGPLAARDFADLVVRTALEAAIENESYFKNLEPHLLMVTLRGLGIVEERIDAGFRQVRVATERNHELLKEIHSIISDRGGEIASRGGDFQRSQNILDRRKYASSDIFKSITLSGDLLLDLLVAEACNQGGFSMERIEDMQLMVRTEDAYHSGYLDNLHLDYDPDVSYIVLSNRTKIKFDNGMLVKIAYAILNEGEMLGADIFEPVQARLCLSGTNTFNGTKPLPVEMFYVEFIYCINFDDIKIEESARIDLLMLLLFDSWSDWEFIWGNNTTTLSRGFVAQKLMRKIDLKRDLPTISERIKSMQRHVDVDSVFCTLNSLCLYVIKRSELFSKSEMDEFTEAIALHGSSLSIYVREFIKSRNPSLRIED
ncbi:MAG: hypothetical protein AAF675_00140 [Pseudomonadota bacterium]